MNSDTLKAVLLELAERALPKGFTRDIELPTDSGKVIGLIVPRRCGKTFLFFATMLRLRQQGVDPRRILYLNFEDDRLHPRQAAELDLVLRCQRELFEVARSGKLYLFLDEVQAAPGWERWVRRLHDTEDISIFVTGSSSSRLLNRDLSTTMRGRSISLEVLPLSFREFLRFRRIEHVPHDARSEICVRAAFAEFVQQGGLPKSCSPAPSCAR